MSTTRFTHSITLQNKEVLILTPFFLFSFFLSLRDLATSNSWHSSTCLIPLRRYLKTDHCCDRIHICEKIIFCSWCNLTCLTYSIPFIMRNYWYNSTYAPQTLSTKIINETFNDQTLVNQRGRS